MKKTIITLLALAGIATAAFEETPLWTLDFGNQYSSGYDVTNHTKEFTYNPEAWSISANASGTVTSTTRRVHLVGDIGVTWKDDFALTLTFTLPESITGENNYPVLASLTTGDSAQLYYGPYLGNSNYINIDGHNGTVFTKTVTNQVMLSGGETYTATLTVIDHVATLYVNDSVAAQGKLDSSVYTGTINNLLLGGRKVNDRRMPATFKSVSLSLIPEPTTATLSLLALCGLAARRRRR